MGFFPRANTVSLHSTSIIHHTGLRTWEYGLTIPYSKSYSICNILFVQLDDKKPFFHSGILIVQMQLPLVFRNKSKKSHTRLISQLFGAFLRPHLLITNKSTPVLILLSPNISGNPAVDMTMSMMTWKTGQSCFNLFHKIRQQINTSFHVGQSRPISTGSVSHNTVV